MTIVELKKERIMQLALVPFYQDNLVLINHNGEPFVAMKPVVVQMGLDWKAQQDKLAEKFSSVRVIIPSTGEDGKQYDMICLPLRKLPAWLYSISPNKVAPEIKDKVIQYQEECDDVLWQYWTTGFAGNAPQANKVSVAHLRYRTELIDKLERERHPIKREAMYEQLKMVSDELNLSTPELENLGFKNVHEELLDGFWEFYQANKDKLNHSVNPEVIAVNANSACEMFSKYCHKPISRQSLIKAFTESGKPKYIDNKNVRSGIEKTTVRCYIFEDSFTE